MERSVNIRYQTISVLRRSVRCAALLLAAILAVTSSAAAATVIITWDANPEPAVAGYIVYVGTSAGNYTASYDVGKTTTFSLADAAAGTTYHLAVRAYENNTNLSPLSVELTATVPGGVALTAPTLLAPAGTTASTTPTFSWSAVSGATAYTLWVDDATAVGKIQQVYAATDLGCAAGTGTCAVTSPVTLARGAASWWVQATTATGNGPWSATGSFTVKKK
jgi:hypothetical protein